MQTNKILVILYIFFSLQCGSSFLLIEDAFLKRPNGIEIMAVSGKSFVLSYFVQNQEVSFNGYNLYISKSTITDAEVNTQIRPLTISGTLPTYQLSEENFDLDIPRKETLSFFNDPPISFEVGIRYYFRLAASSYTNLVSQASNEATAVCLP